LAATTTWTALANVAAIKSACQNVIDLLAAGKFVVAAGSRSAALKNSHGVLIYIPLQDISPLYARLDFTKDTAWGEFLQKFVSATRRRGQ
jgi:hypothetical protein